MKQPLPLSIIIPAYNEERYLYACLDAIAAQTVKPLEVLVVNNNSTDATVAIAEGYSFVKVLHEKRQHQAYAQVTGFAAAKGKIFARIDADTVLPPDWAQKVIDLFEKDAETVAFSGHPDPYDVPAKGLGVLLFKLYHCLLTRWHAGHMLLWGSNCAFRGELWSQVQPRLHLRPDIWEDYDLGFALAPYGHIADAPNIVVGCSFRSLQRPVIQQVRYHFRSVRTFRLNTAWWRTALQVMLRLTIILILPFSWIERIFARFKHLPLVK